MLISGLAAQQPASDGAGTGIDVRLFGGGDPTSKEVYPTGQEHDCERFDLLLYATTNH